MLDQLKEQVVEKLHVCISRAEAYYGVTFPMPTICYLSLGTTGGFAYFKDWRIELNVDLLIDYGQRFIDSTVPHEFAHLVDRYVNPLPHPSHGPTWRHACRVIGYENASRSHTYDVDDLRNWRSSSRSIEWKCLKCNHIVKQSLKKTGMLRENAQRFTHRNCGGLFEIVDKTQFVVKSGSTEVSIPPSHPLAMGKSKYAICESIYKAAHNRSRKELIELFKKGALCSDAAASTYLYKLKKQFGSR